MVPTTIILKMLMDLESETTWGSANGDTGRLVVDTELLPFYEKMEEIRRMPTAQCRRELFTLMKAQNIIARK